MDAKPPLLMGPQHSKGILKCNMLLYDRDGNMSLISALNKKNINRRENISKPIKVIFLIRFKMSPQIMKHIRLMF